MKRGDIPGKLVLIYFSASKEGKPGCRLDFGGEFLRGELGRPGELDDADANPWPLDDLEDQDVVVVELGRVDLDFGEVVALAAIQLAHLTHPPLDEKVITGGSAVQPRRAEQGRIAEHAIPYYRHSGEQPLFLELVCQIDRAVLPQFGHDINA